MNNNSMMDPNEFYGLRSNNQNNMRNNSMNSNNQSQNNTRNNINENNSQNLSNEAIEEFDMEFESLRENIITPNTQNNQSNQNMNQNNNRNNNISNSSLSNAEQIRDIQNNLISSMESGRQSFDEISTNTIDEPGYVISEDYLPLDYVDNNISSQAFEISQDRIQYLNGFVGIQIGKDVNVDFLIGNNNLIKKTGILVGVGADYILINEYGSDDIIACRFEDIRFITFFEQ